MWHTSGLQPATRLWILNGCLRRNPCQSVIMSFFVGRFGALKEIFIPQLTDDFEVEAGSMIPDGDQPKEKITWETQASLKVTLRHCARIAQGVSWTIFIGWSCWSTVMLSSFIITEVPSLDFSIHKMPWDESTIGYMYRMQQIMFLLHLHVYLPLDRLRRQHSTLSQCRPLSSQRSLWGGQCAKQLLYSYIFL